MRIGVAPLADAGLTPAACDWAMQMALNGHASHGGTQPCSGEVVALGGSANHVVSLWFGSPQHYGSLTWSLNTSISLAFVTVTNDPHWPYTPQVTYGVGQLC